MITEEHVLKNCMHNDDSVIESVFFPQFSHELCHVTCGVGSGYYSATNHIMPVTFDEWKMLRYREFRSARYLPVQEQIDMNYHDTLNGTNNLMTHLSSVKSKYPKP